MDANAKLMIGMRRCADLLGKNKDFFYHIKRNNRPFFDHIVDISDHSLIDGYKTYIQDVDDMIDVFFPLYNKLEDNCNVLTFAKAYGYNNQTIRSMANTMGGKSVMTYNRYLKLEKMIPKMEQFIKENYEK